MPRLGLLPAAPRYFYFTRNASKCQHSTKGCPLAVLGCDVEELLALSSCFECLSENQLLQIEVLLREQFYADGAGGTPRGIKELLVASQRWSSLTEHQRQAIELRELCNSVVIVGARSSCDADELKNESACYCASSSKLKSIIAYLKCLQLQT